MNNLLYNLLHMVLISIEICMIDNILLLLSSCFRESLVAGIVYAYSATEIKKSIIDHSSYFLPLMYSLGFPVMFLFIYFTQFFHFVFLLGALSALVLI